MTDFVAFWRDTATLDLKHFKGAGRWQDFSAWEAIGQRTLRFLRDGGLDQTRNDHVFFEWGPGGGANLAALMPYARSYYGVDVSQDSLDECALIAPVLFKPVFSDGPPPQIGPAAWVDVFLSTACFQHFPDRGHGRAVLAELARIAKPGAIGLIQIRYGTADGGDTYAQRFLSATTWSTDDFADDCRAVGLQPLFPASIQADVRYAYFTLKRL